MSGNRYSRAQRLASRFKDEAPGTFFLNTRGEVIATSEEEAFALHEQGTRWTTLVRVKNLRSCNTHVTVLYGDGLIHSLLYIREPGFITWTSPDAESIKQLVGIQERRDRDARDSPDAGRRR